MEERRSVVTQEDGWAPQLVWTPRTEDKAPATAGNRTVAVQPVAVPTEVEAAVALAVVLEEVVVVVVVVVMW
jgi:hypothetical protein